MIDNYAALPLGLFMELDAINRSDAEDLDKQVSIIARLAGLDERDVLDLPLADYSALAAKTDFLRHECPPATAPSRLISGDFVLVPTKDFTQITTAQYVDFQTFSKKGIDALPDLLSVLLIPEGHKYNDGYDIAKVKETVLELPLPAALGLSAFFFERLVASIQASLTSLEGVSKMVPASRKAEAREKLETIRQAIRGLGLPASTE